MNPMEKHPRIQEDTPMNTSTQATRFPPALIWTAGIAIILFCGTGFAALMGWLPTSMGQDAPAVSGKASPTGKTNTASTTNAGNASPQARKAPVQTAAVSPAVKTCTDCGVIESTKAVVTKGQGSGLGAVGGAVVGGLLGNQIGDGRGQQIATVAGAIGGVVAGNEIEKRAKSSTSYDVTVRLNDGSNRVIRQASEPTWRAGDKVRIVDGSIQSI